MKTRIFPIFLFTVLFAVLVLSCEKDNTSTGVTPDYKENGGTGGNPNQNNPTVTGTSTLSNPATSNTTFSVGGSGWTNPTCGSTNSLTLKGTSGASEVTISFFSTIVSGTYAIGGVPSSSICSMTVLNAPGQPAGIVWKGKTGQVVVNTSASSINAFFTSIQCTQPDFIYPIVGVSGNIGCSQ